MKVDNLSVSNLKFSNNNDEDDYNKTSLHFEFLDYMEKIVFMW